MKYTNESLLFQQNLATTPFIEIHQTKELSNIWKIWKMELSYLGQVNRIS